MTRYFVLRYIFGRYVVVHSYRTRCYGRATTTVIVCGLGLLGLAETCLARIRALPGSHLGLVKGWHVFQWVS